jgi:hypothetical protein
MKDRSSILVSQLKLRKPSQLNNSKRYFGKLTDKDNYNKSPETKINKLQVLDIEDVNCLEMCIKNYFSQKSHVWGEMNEALFQGMIFSLFNECEVETHTFGVEVNSGKGRLDIVLYPIKGKSTKAIITELKIAQNYKQMNDKCEEAVNQIIEKRYIYRVLIEAQKNPHIREIGIVALVAFVNKTKKQIEIKVENYVFTIEAMNKFYSHFKELSQKDWENVLKKTGFNHMMKTFKDTGSFESILKKETIISIFVNKLGKLIKNKKLGNQLYEIYGNKLFNMNKRELEKVEGVSKIRAATIVEFLKEY